MEKNKRRQFLKNTSLSLLSASILPTIVKSENISDNFEKDSVVSCNHSTEDAYGQGPFYTANAPAIINNQLANVNEPGIKIILVDKYLILNVQKLFQIQKLIFGMPMMRANMITLVII